MNTSIQNSILIQSLKVFSGEELDQLSHFLECPLFNKGSHSKQNLEIFNLLKEILLSRTYEKLDKVWISQNLVSAGSLKSVGNKYLDNRMSEIMNVVRKFLTWKEVEVRWGDTFEDVATTRFFRERKLSNLQKQTIGRAKKNIDKHKMLNEELMIVDFWVNEEVFILENMENQRQGNLNIPATIESLSLFYVTNLLKIAMVQVQQYRIVPEFIPTWDKMILEIRMLFQSYNFLGQPTLLMLEAALKLIEDNSGEPMSNLQKYLTLINQNEDKIHISTLQNLSTYARNYCNWQINLGFRELREIRLSLYKEHLKKGWLFENGQIGLSTFINMINIGLWANEKDWVLYLLNNYGNSLLGEDREKIINYGFALYYCNIKKFSEARIHVNNLTQAKKFCDISLERLARILVIKIYYLDEDKDILENALHNFLMFIRRQSEHFGESIFKANVNFIKQLKKISQIREDKKLKKRTTDKIKKIKKKLNELNSCVSERLWLLDMLDELI